MKLPVSSYRGYTIRCVLNSHGWYAEITKGDRWVGVTHQPNFDMAEQAEERARQKIDTLELASYVDSLRFM